MKLIVPLFLLFTIALVAQSNDLDKEQIDVSYVQLPTNPVLEFEKRTFSTTIPGLRINGYTRTEENPTLIIEYTEDPTMVDGVEVLKKKYEKKDKEGNVTSTYYRYTATATYTTTSSLYISNNNGGPSSDFSYNENFTYKSKEFTTRTEAAKHYNSNKTNLRNKYQNAHSKALENTAKLQVAGMYSYRPQTKRYSYMWILGSKKHPEFEAHHAAYEEAKAAFDLMTAQGSTEDMAAALAPVMEYFEEVIPRYEGTKKKMRKVRYASLYNIAMMYYYLDNHEKTAEYGQKIIDNDYSKSDGRDFLRMAEQLKNILEINQVDSRHFVIDAPEIK